MLPPKRLRTLIRSFDEGFVKSFRDAYYNGITWVWFIVMIVFLMLATFASSRIGLLNILAYEFSAVIGLFVCHSTAILVIREFDRLRTVLEHRSPFSSGPHPRLVIWGVVLGSIAAAGWLMIVPLIGITILGLVFSIRNCDPLTGLGFYITIPLVSAFFGASLGTFCALGTSTHRRAGWLYVTIVFLFLIRLVVKFGWGHTIGFHDPFIGLFSLPLYDREANLDSSFVFSRLFLIIGSTLLITISILCADKRFQKYSPSNLFANLKKADMFLPEIQAMLLLGVLFILGFYYQGPLGIEITRRYVEHVLDGRVGTEHFIIRYPTGGEVEEDIERIAEDHEFYYWSIVNEIEVAPEGMIRAYIYPDRTTKTFLTGVGAGVYAKPWTGEIHVEYNRNKIRALKHELVHVISAPMGIPLFGSSLLFSYGEGIAEGVQWETGNDLTYHQWSAALREAIDPYTDESFFPRENAPFQLLNHNFKTGGFMNLRKSMSYYLSASHTKWFLDTFGPDAYKKAYIFNDTERAIGWSREDTADAWMQYLDHVPLRAEEIAYARLGFSPPRFVTQVCAHEIAEHERLSEQYVQRSLWADACEEFSILLDFSPENIRYGYQQIRMIFYQEKYEDALNRLHEIRQWESADEGWDSYLLLLEGDIHARSKQADMAEEAYGKARDAAVTISIRRNAILRLDMLDSPALDEFLAALREPDDARWRLERARSLDDGWLPLYYLANNLVADRMYEEARELLLDCLERNLPYPFVERNCLFYMGICAYRNEEYSTARGYFQDAGIISSDLFRGEHPSYDGVIPLVRLDSWSATISDWLDRCNWRETWSGLVEDTDEQR